MRKDIVWSCEQMMGVKLSPHQKALLKLMDKVENLIVFHPRCCATHDAEWMASIVAKMIVTNRSNEGGNGLDKAIDKGYLEDLYRGAKEVFCNGIYVKSERHPCGWDFISFEDLECSADVFDMPIENDAISGGCYHYSEFEDLTVEEIVKTVGAKGWCFEISGVDNLQ